MKAGKRLAVMRDDQHVSAGLVPREAEETFPVGLIKRLFHIPQLYTLRERCAFAALPKFDGCLRN